MLLSLLFFARIPLFTALAASKLANSCSALVSLSSFAAGGYVHLWTGLVVAAGIGLGAFIGAQFASKKATQAVRPVLAVVVILLVCKIALH